ncbi:hypothetical protein C7402_112308 [Paraburkholderia unamae]|uniref:Uncharacterized protein n=1 Tax=Paraburkholderia unamae TaxID=219649 RepID=A0ABX5KII6_9BURK|nr:hypothetical protein C7402_112308 [Paraburkholderia unamae]CAG9268449.1 hypothetical protein PUN4_560001 [Paraburkholderia unamae]
MQVAESPVKRLSKNNFWGRYADYLTRNPCLPTRLRMKMRCHVLNARHRPGTAYWRHPIS